MFERTAFSWLDSPSSNAWSRGPAPIADLVFFPFVRLQEYIQRQAKGRRCPDAQKSWRRIACRDGGLGARVSKLGTVGIFKPGIGRLYVQKLYGKAFLCGKPARLPGTGRKLHGRMYLVQSRGAEEKAEERSQGRWPEEEIDVDLLSPSPGGLRFSAVAGLGLYSHIYT